MKKSKTFLDDSQYFFHPLTVTFSMTSNTYSIVNTVSAISQVASVALALTKSVSAMPWPERHCLDHAGCDENDDTLKTVRCKVDQLKQQVYEGKHSPANKE